MTDFDEGLKLGHRIEHRVALEAVAGALLDILGKDGADGVIDLGAAGSWVKTRDGWKQTKLGGPRARLPKLEARVHDYRRGVAGASK